MMYLYEVINQSCVKLTCIHTKLYSLLQPITKQNNENNLNVEQFIAASRVWH